MKKLRKVIIIIRGYEANIKESDVMSLLFCRLFSYDKF